MTLDEAIKYHEDMSKERYLNDGSHKQLAEWLKELKRDRRILANLYNELSAIKINCEKVKDAI